MKDKYKGMKAICDILFTLVASGTVFWSNDFSAFTAIVLFTQNIMVCYNEIDDDRNVKMFIINIFTLIVDGIALFLLMGIQIANKTDLIMPVRWISLVCLARTIFIFANWLNRHSIDTVVSTDEEVQ